MTPQEFEHALKCVHTFDRTTAAYADFITRLRDHDIEQRAEIAELRERAQAAEWYEALVKRACIGTSRTPSLKVYIEQCEQEIARLQQAFKECQGYS